jgi:uncharacterized caspase-like protein
MKKSVISLSSLLFIFLNLSGCTLPVPLNESFDPKIEVLPAENSNRVALVIGNGNYKSQALSNPIPDAQDMSDTLNQLGFGVTQVLNADQATMNKAIQEFGQELHSDRVGLLYYSGYGVQYEGKNYMIPIGAMLAIDEPSDLNTDAVSVNGVLSMMEQAKNRLNLVVLDACRDNPFEGFTKGDRKTGLAPVSSAEGMLVAYATSPNKAALTSKKRNSPYTKHLLQYMEQDLPIELMLKQVREAVKNETDGKQTPWYATSIEGNFTFATPLSRHDLGVGF